MFIIIRPLPTVKLNREVCRHFHLCFTEEKEWYKSNTMWWLKNDWIFIFGCFVSLRPATWANEPIGKTASHWYFVGLPSGKDLQHSKHGGRAMGKEAGFRSVKGFLFLSSIPVLDFALRPNQRPTAADIQRHLYTLYECIFHHIRINHAKWTWS